MRRALKAAQVVLCLGVALAPPRALRAEESSLPAGADPKRLAAFEAAARRQMAADHTTGLAIAYSVDDAVWARAFGLADVENGAPMKPESSFRLASVSKPMTAMAVLQLVEAGKIDLDAEIQTYVPDFPRKKYPITVRQLLGHLGGISHYKNADAELHIREHKTTREALAIFQDFDLVAEPGTKYSYTTYGFNLLGAAVEGASGQAYGDYMRTHVWAPLGMDDTRMDDPRAIIPNRVRGYEWDDGALKVSEYVDVSSRFGGGGARSTVIDLLKFARGVMEGRLVSKETVERMTRPMVLKDGRYTDYGMGWGIDPQNGRHVVAHSGSQNETRTMILLLPRRHMAIAAATNFESGDLYWYVRALVAAVLGERWDASGGSAAYLPGRIERAQFAAVRDAFQFGLSDYERDGRPITEDPKKLKDAFAFFDRCVDRKALEKDVAGTRQRCRDGVHPVAGEPIAIVGSFAAKTLAGAEKDAARLERYHVSGPAAFFADYARAAAEKGYPPALRVDARFEERLERWARDWPRTFDAATVSPAATASWGLDARALRERFAGASIVPDLNAGLRETVRQACVDGRRDAGLDAASLAHELYPDMARPAVTLAAAEACFGAPGQVRPLLQLASRLDDGEAATSPRALNGIAYGLAESGRLVAAAAFLRTALELHPQEANLYDSLGEIEGKAGHRDAARAAYEKALELDPKLDSARRALEALRKAS